MKDIKQAALLDFIISELIKNHENTDSNNYSYSFITKIFHENKDKGLSVINKNSMDDSKARDLFNIIFETEFKGNPIIEHAGYGNVSKNTGNVYYNTIDFRDYGGFTKRFKIENQVQEKNNKKEELEDKLLENRVKLTTRQLIVFWFTFVSSIIALGLSIINFFTN